MKANVLQKIRSAINKRLVRLTPFQKFHYWKVKNRYFRKFYGMVENRNREYFKEQYEVIIEKLKKQTVQSKSITKKSDVDWHKIQLNSKAENARMRKEILPVMEQLYEESKAGTLQLIGVELPDAFTAMSDIEKEILDNELTTVYSGVSKTTNKLIKNQLIEGIGLDEGYHELATRIRNVFTNATQYRARMIAVTETARVNSTANESAMAQSGVVVGKEWTVEPGACPICLDLRGEKVPLGESFSTVDNPPAHPNCFDKYTEVYTDNGWKFFKDLDENDKIWSLKPNNLTSEFVKYKNFVKYKADKIVEYSGRSFNLANTLNHNQFVKFRIKNKGRKDAGYFKLIQEDELPNNDFSFYSGINWLGKNTEFIRIGRHNIDAVSYCRFMGWYLSEGSAVKRGEKWYQISISQKKYKDMVIEDLNRLPIKIQIGKETISFNDLDFGKYLLKFGKSNEKFVPKEIKKMSKELIEQFLETYLLGDGSYKEGKIWKGFKFSGQGSYFTSSKRMADDIGELIMKIGKKPSFKLSKCKGKKIKFKNGEYKINNNIWKISECKNVNTDRNRLKKEIRDYDDYVYDVELERNHILLVRRNGKVVWSGNCRCDITPVFTKEELD